MGRKKLRFPIITGANPSKKILSMDEYLEFVLFHLKYTFNQKTYKKWKKISAVTAPFSIKE